MATDNTPGAGGGRPGTPSSAPAEGTPVSPAHAAATQANRKRGGGLTVELRAAVRVGGGGATLFGGQEDGGTRIGFGEPGRNGIVIELRAAATATAGRGATLFGGQKDDGTRIEYPELESAAPARRLLPAAPTPGGGQDEDDTWKILPEAAGGRKDDGKGVGPNNQDTTPTRRDAGSKKGVSKK